MENAEEELINMDNITFASSEYECVKGKSACFIATPWKQFYKLDARKLLESMNEDSVIIDAWGVIPYEKTATSPKAKDGLFKKQKVIEVKKIGKSQIISKK